MSEANSSPIPRATYRLQFHKEFGFRDAAALAPYLARLGVSHIYASPYLKARPGSTHGYDIVDHAQLNPDLGDKTAFDEMVTAFRDNGLGQILDFAPNYMGVGGADNPWWLDVLEWGPQSEYAGWFDIDWEPDSRDLEGKLLVPFLGDHYGAVLESGQLTLGFDPQTGGFAVIAYDTHKLPICPLHYQRVLGDEHPELSRLGDAFSGLPDWRPRVAQRAKDLQAELGGLARQRSDVRQAVQAAVDRINGQPGHLVTWRRLDELIQDQYWRAAYFRVAADDINYRRFFDINELAGLRMELPELFDQAHRLAFELLRDGVLDGLRICHIDGLLDPKGYLLRLREQVPKSFYLAVEKTLAHHEVRRGDWPVDGSAGYEFANHVLGLFVEPENERAMTRLYQRLTGRTDDFDAVLLAAKQRIMRVNLASEMSVLARRFHRLSTADWRTRDFTLKGMLGALEQIIAAFPVYRTYVSERGTGADDRRYIDWAVAQAKKQARTADTSIFDCIHQVLTGELPHHPRPADVLRTAMQFQQVTGPVMAKAAEDTAFYRYFRLLALNEVGGDPRRFGLSCSAFHRLNAERARLWPQAMLTTATHDTKRGEDARIRIAMLSEMPTQWAHFVMRWLRFNRSRRSELDGDVVPDRNVEYLFYQTLVGVWPPGLALADAEGIRTLAERVGAYMTKAVREGKVESSWSNPNAPYEAALKRFVAAVLDASRPNPFLTDFHAFIELLTRPAAIASMAQLVLKLTAPGVPDIYQGCELFDFSLVDPDNRRPVDWERRQSLLDRIGNAAPGDLAEAWQDGREKLFVTIRLLALRRADPALFATGSYQPLEISGGRNADRLCAFTRRYNGAVLATIVPRLVYGLFRDGAPADFGATKIALPPAASWRNVFTDAPVAANGQIRAAELLRDFPVAVLVGENVGAR
jgi:(1->4)-alpha-D-glucan 1-alpha-D-glucosylmutase